MFRLSALIFRKAADDVPAVASLPAWDELRSLSVDLILFVS